jgi:hypothetical protein
MTPESTTPDFWSVIATRSAKAAEWMAPRRWEALVRREEIRPRLARRSLCGQCSERTRMSVFRPLCAPLGSPLAPPMAEEPCSQILIFKVPKSTGHEPTTQAET